MRSRTAQIGATLLYGPRSPRPDLVLAAQLLIDDLRAEGRRIGYLRMSKHFLRLRLDELELALALSAGPLPLEGIGTVLRLPPGRSRTAPFDPAGEDPGFTDLGSIRIVRALRQHQTALGVLLRRRGSGPAALEAELRLLLLTLIEAAPPGLVLWHPTGVVWPEAEFRRLDARALAAAGPPLPRLAPATARAEGVVRALAAAEAPVPAGDRRTRASCRSAGRLFDGTGAAAPLPRLEPAAARLAEALREDRAAPPRPAPAARPRHLRLAGMALAAWLMLGAPPWSSLQAMLP
jgi:hypothetical protein